MTTWHQRQEQRRAIARVNRMLTGLGCLSLFAIAIFAFVLLDVWCVGMALAGMRKT